MTDRVPGAPGQYLAQLDLQQLEKMQAGEAFTITLVRDDQPLTEGTPYSKAAVLPDALAKQLCPQLPDPTPADALRALYEKCHNQTQAGQSVVRFENGTAIFRHGCGFADENAYVFVWMFQSNRYIPVCAGNVDGNSVRIVALDYGENGTIVSNFTGELPINWVAAACRGDGA